MTRGTSHRKCICLLPITTGITYFLDKRYFRSKWRKYVLSMYVVPVLHSVSVSQNFCLWLVFWHSYCYMAFLRMSLQTNKEKGYFQKTKLELVFWNNEWTKRKHGSDLPLFGFGSKVNVYYSLVIVLYSTNDLLRAANAIAVSSPPQIP